VLNPGRCGLQHGLNERTLQQDAVPPDEHIIQMVGGIGSEQQARFSIGNQEQQCWKQVSGGSKPGRALQAGTRTRRGSGKRRKRGRSVRQWRVWFAYRKPTESDVLWPVPQRKSHSRHLLPVKNGSG